MLLLELKDNSKGWIDFSSISFDEIATLPIEEIESKKLERSRKQVSLGELFRISRRTGADASLPERIILLQGDFTTSSFLGVGLQSTSLIVDGNGGEEVGAELRGGTILVAGGVGTHAGAGMEGGRLIVAGNCGDRLAAPKPGMLSGMRGGDILIGGSVGDRPAERMRRGTVYVRGSCGDHGCAEMIAGTFVCEGTIGKEWCNGMRRGTLLLGQEAKLQLGGRMTPSRKEFHTWLSILNRHFRKVVNEASQSLKGVGLQSFVDGWKIELQGAVDKRIGDRRCEGVGEILIQSVRG